MNRSLRVTQATEIGCENNKKLREVYKSSHIVRLIKTRVRCVGHVAGWGGGGGLAPDVHKNLGTYRDGDGGKTWKLYLSPNTMQLRRTRV
jgi:hypothetical protein